MRWPAGESAKTRGLGRDRGRPDPAPPVRKIGITKPAMTRRMAMRMPITKINTERLFTPHTSQRHPSHDQVKAWYWRGGGAVDLLAPPEGRPPVTSTPGAEPASSARVVNSQVASSREMPWQAAHR